MSRQIYKLDPSILLNCRFFNNFAQIKLKCITNEFY
jgi:hypothetical protein